MSSTSQEYFGLQKQERSTILMKISSVHGNVMQHSQINETGFIVKMVIIGDSIMTEL